MSIIRMACPPLPHFLVSGEDLYAPGHRHMSRHSIGVFDLLVVTRGCLFMGEEQSHWQVEAGSFLLLRPDRYHYAVQDCVVETHFHWLHFQIMGAWSEAADGAAPCSSLDDESGFTASLPRFGRLAAASDAYGQLELLHGTLRRSKMEWKHQIIFQQLLLSLEQTHSPLNQPAVYRIAEEAAAYLRQHYDEPFHNDRLGAALSFHPAYITRCTKQIFGLTPLEYLTKYRIERAKGLLMNTELPIGRIAEEVGFETFSFFSRCFHKQVLMSPRDYRKRMWAADSGPQN